MRTTLDIDERLIEEVAAYYPPRTPKSVLAEEAFRSLRRELRAGTAPGGVRRAGLSTPLASLAAEGLLRPHLAEGPPPRGHGLGLAQGQLQADLDADRADRE